MQERDRNAARAEFRPGSEAASNFWAAAHFSKSTGGSTITRINMFACCVPQYSAQFPRKIPSCLGSIHMVFMWPGIKSVLPASWGTQKLCATSAESSVRKTGADWAAVLADILKRDERDQNRPVAPL